MALGLEFLEPEIQRQILLLAETLEDIRNLIQTSPRLYQVFSLNKEYILSTVARGQLHPAVLPDVLFYAKVCRLSPIEEADVVEHRCQVDDHEMRRWLDNAPAMPEIVAICELARSVDYFIQDYAQSALPLMEERGRSDELDDSPNYLSERDPRYINLSTSEVGRLQRAF